MIIHFSILVVIIVCALLWERVIKRKKISAIYRGETYDAPSCLLPWLITFGYVAFLAAMRSGMNDTSVYMRSFELAPGTWDEILRIAQNHVKDRGFDITANLFKMFVSKDYHLWFAMFSVIESGIFIYILRRKSVSFFDSCFFFFCSTLYYNYFSMMRQWFAVLLVFWGIRLIEKDRLFLYIMLCIVAAQYHESAYLCILFYFLAKGKAWGRKQVVILVVTCFVMIYLGSYMDTLTNVLDGTTYDYVFEAMANAQGSSGIRAFITAVPVVIAFFVREKIPKEDKIINLCTNMSILNFLLNVFATFTSGLFVIRMATYTSVYNLILYPYLLNVTITGKNKTIIRMTFLLFYLIFYCYQMSHQGAWGYNSDILGVYQ